MVKFEAVCVSHRNVLKSVFVCVFPKCALQTLTNNSPPCCLPKVQPFAIWRGGELPLEPAHIDAFIFEDAVLVNIMIWIGGDFGDRHKCKIWTPIECDVQGCKSFAHPRPLRPLVPLSSSKVPVLALREEAMALGFTPVARRVEHMNAPPKVFDDRMPSREYLQCVVASAHLFEAGAAPFKSKLSATHYKLLLKCPDADINRLSCAVCKQRLKDLEGTGTTIAELEEFPQGHGEALAAVEDRLDADDPEPAEPMPAILEMDLGEVDGDDAMDGDEAGEGIDGDMDEPPITHICGALLREEARVTRNGTFTDGWRIICPTHGRLCSKYRAKRLRVEHEGRHAALYFLGAWCHAARRPTMTMELHSTYTPTVDEIHEFMRHADCP